MFLEIEFKYSQINSTMISAKNVQTGNEVCRKIAEGTLPDDYVLTATDEDLFGCYLNNKLEMGVNEEVMPLLKFCVQRNLTYNYVLCMCLLYKAGSGKEYLAYALQHSELFGLNSRYCDDDDEEPTPLHIAVNEGDFDSVRALLAAGADRTIKSKTRAEINEEEELDQVHPEWLRTPLELAQTKDFADEMRAIFNDAM